MSRDQSDGALEPFLIDVRLENIREPLQTFGGKPNGFGDLGFENLRMGGREQDRQGQDQKAVSFIDLPGLRFGGQDEEIAKA